MFRNKKWVCLMALALLVSFFYGCSVRGRDNVGPIVNAVNVASVSAHVETEAKELSVTDLLKAVFTLKSDLEKSLEDLVDQNPDAAAVGLQAVGEKSSTVRRSLNATITNLGDEMPAVKKQLENIQSILDLIDTLNEQIMQPSITVIRENPLDELSTEDGVRVDLLEKYIDFADGLMPAVEALVTQAQTVDLSIVDSDGDLTSKLEKANKLLAFYKQDPAIFTTLKTMLGVNRDRTYVLAAQNSAEIRASGGFPGAIGVMRIQNGILSIQDFQKVYDILSSNTPAEAKVTSQETNLFHGGLSAPRDADYCPDFERVAYIWTLGYEARQTEAVDGVISVTPVVVQRLLNVMDQQITLSDGLTMDGSNACRVLQYDLYYKYFGNQYVANSKVLADQFFAEAAKKTMLLLQDNMEGQKLSGYLYAAKESIADRTVMIWMKDETEQAIIRSLGCNGGLNSNPEKPEAGVYVNCVVASKMGIFFEMDTKMGKCTQNSDGSYTYPITVTFRNTITKDEINKASAYITGGSGGFYSGSAYFFAPAGGTVGNFSSDGQVYIQEAEYHDLQLGYLRSFQIAPGKSLTITYDVTTAPGVEAKLRFSKTPTLQNYR